jgi:hypothetical protein
LQSHRTPAGQTLFSFINTIPGRRSLKQITLPPTSGFVQLGLDVVAIIGSAYPSFGFGGRNSAGLLLVNFGF